jgi:hypothetical protein
MTIVSVVLHAPGNDRSRVGASAIEALASVPARCLASQDGPRLWPGHSTHHAVRVASLMNSPFSRQGGLPRRAVTRRTGGGAAYAARSGSRVASRHTAKRPSISITQE